MTIGIDIDDTLCNTNEILNSMIVENTALTEFNKEYDLCDRYQINEKQKEKLLKMFYNKSLEKAELYLDWKGVLNKIYEEGHKVIFITSRPNNANVRKITHKWLKNNDISYHRIIFGAKNKAEVCSRYGVMLFIDDKYEMCKQVEDIGILSLQYAKANNYGKIKNIKSGKEIFTYMDKVCPYEYIDVDDLKNLPKCKNGFRYLDYLGGYKNYRCYIVPFDLARCDFNQNYPYVIHESLLPVYDKDGILITQDNSFALPGFYILSFTKQYISLDKIPEDLYIKAQSLLYKLRAAMRDVLKIEHVNIYYEEKNTNSNNVHFWVMPKYDSKKLQQKLYDFQLNKYLNKFEFKENKLKIIEANKKIKQYFDKNEM